MDDQDDNHDPSPSSVPSPVPVPSKKQQDEHHQLEANGIPKMIAPSSPRCLRGIIPDDDAMTVVSTQQQVALRNSNESQQQQERETIVTERIIMVENEEENMTKLSASTSHHETTKSSSFGTDGIITAMDHTSTTASSSSSHTNSNNTIPAHPTYETQQSQPEGLDTIIGDVPAITALRSVSVLPPLKQPTIAPPSSSNLFGNKGGSFIGKPQRVTSKGVQFDEESISKYHQHGTTVKRETSTGSTSVVATSPDTTITSPINASSSSMIYVPEKVDNMMDHSTIVLHDGGGSHVVIEEQPLRGNNNTGTSTSYRHHLLLLHHVQHQQQQYSSNDDYDAYSYGTMSMHSKHPYDSKKSSRNRIQQSIEHTCFPHGLFVQQNTTLFVAMIAMLLTKWMSWDCTYFRGATISFTGNMYGLWTLQDDNGKCQLWDVLFFSYNLGTPLVAARCFSMAAMLVGLSLLTTICQALQFHAMSWTIGIIYLLLFLISQATISIYNVWVAFWFLSYLIFVLIVRYLFIHPYHRRISHRGNIMIASGFIFCAICCILTMVVLKSDFCTCHHMTAENLSGRHPGEPCLGTCELGPSGYLAVLSCVFWLASAYSVMHYGTQPQDIIHHGKNNRPSMYQHLPRYSLTTHVLTKILGKRVNLPTTTLDSSIVGDADRDGHSNDDAVLQKGETSNGVFHSNCTMEPSLHIDKETVDTTSITETTATDRTNPIKTSIGTNDTAVETTKIDAQDSNEHSNKSELTSYQDIVVSYSGSSSMNQQQPQYHPRHEEHRLPSRLEQSRVSEMDPEGAALEQFKPEEEEDNDDEQQGVFTDNRSRIQRCCCDYRMKPRSHSERCLFWSFRILLGFLIAFYMLMVTLLIGQRVENTRADKAPDTSRYFVTRAVCAFDPLNPTDPFTTFTNKISARIQGYSVAHCGKCGQCSNPADIRKYVETRKTIAKTAKECGPVSMLGTYDQLVSCLEKKIGLSRDCTKCWADNMVNTGQKCLFTCLTTLFTGFMGNNNVPGAGQQGWLNKCLFCDEKLSGPAFVTCSGVARRRLGIKSEIERNPEEQCPQSDLDWVNVNWTEIGFDSTTSHQQQLHNKTQE